MSEWKPTDHVSPYKRIDINPRHPVTPEKPRTLCEMAAEDLAARLRIIEAERIWKITRQVSEGTNPPTERA